MSKEEVAEVVKETRTIKLQGRQVERLAALNKRTQVLEEEKAKIVLEQVKVRGGIDALLNLNAEPGEEPTTYDFKKCELVLEKKVDVKEDEVKK